MPTKPGLREACMKGEEEGSRDRERAKVVVLRETFMMTK
jgi:hypothetical protein